jgi:N-acetylmuramoyl-L-alanine amidase
MHLPRFWPLASLFALLAGCASPVYYDKPREWTSTAAVDSIVASYRPALQGRRIFLDPGHGGDDRENRGPEGEAIEADVNLRVALALRSYLLTAGAEVFMSRQRDTTVALQDRPLLALQDSAEVFISLHHNATAGSDPSTNYAAVYYHAREGSPEYHPANHDLARYIERDMSYAMRNAAAPSSPTFDGTLSDYDIYPNSGFAVLRQNRIPAVLVEASFHSHPPEERRLAIEEFNRIEAWGIFLGIGKYFRAGIPSLALRSDSIVTVPRPVMLVEARSASPLDRSTLRLFMDGHELPGRDTLEPGVVALQPDRDLSSGNHQLTGWVRIRQGNSSWPFRRTIIAMLPAKKFDLALHPSSLPTSRLAAARLQIRAYDAKGQPVADGTILHLVANGTGVDSVLITTGGTATAYIPATNEPGRIAVTIESGKASGRISLPVRDSTLRYVSGHITSATGVPIEGALVTLDASTSAPGPDTLDITPPDGRYIAYAQLPDFSALRIARAGYFVRRDVIQSTDVLTIHDVSLAAIADGKLFGKTYVLDARYGGVQTGDTNGAERSSDLNFAIARRLHSLLTALGAHAILMRQGDEQIQDSERARRSAALPRGIYLRIDASSRTERIACEIYPNRANQIIGSALLAGVATCTGLDTLGVAGSADPFYRDVAMSTVSLVIPSVSTGFFGSDEAQKVDAIAWGIARGMLNLEGALPPSVPVFSVRRPDGSPLAEVPVALDETLTRYTDKRGRVDFCGLERPGFMLSTPENPDAVTAPE